jgi:hypothetical protein
MNIAHISVSTIPVLHKYGGAIQRRIIEVAKEQVRRGDKVLVCSVGPRTRGVWGEDSIHSTPNSFSVATRRVSNPCYRLRKGFLRLRRDNVFSQPA